MNIPFPSIEHHLVSYYLSARVCLSLLNYPNYQKDLHSELLPRVQMLFLVKYDPNYQHTFQFLYVSRSQMNNLC